MNKFFLAILLTCTCPLIEAASAVPDVSTPPSQTTAAIMFTPPSGWRYADADALPKHANVMVVGKGEGEFPPSLTLASEAFQGTLRDYLKRVKEINTAKGNQWKDLGNIRTEAGNASLSQVDSRSEWGDVRMMHVILYKDGTIYILTAASLKDEFSKYYKDFFAALRSLKFTSSPRGQE